MDLHKLKSWFYTYLDLPGPAVLRNKCFLLIYLRIKCLDFHNMGTRQHLRTCWKILVLTRKDEVTVVSAVWRCNVMFFTLH